MFDFQSFNPKKIKKELLFLVLIFLFLPGENFYEKLRLKQKEPLVREIEISLPEFSDYPLKTTEKRVPFLTARAAMVVDVPSKVVLFDKKPNFPLHPASTTKIMTALIVLENYQLDEVFTVPNLETIVGRNMALEKGEKMTVKNLLYGLLVQSANDAAYTLASNYPGGNKMFIEAMNKKAITLALFKTHFVNTTGIDQANHYSTAYDLAHLAAYAMKKPLFVEMVGTQKMTISDIENKQKHKLENTNELIGKVSGLLGVKTGWTEGAGECLIAYVEREGRKIITVLLGSQDRFGETEKLIDWVFENYRWQKITRSTQD